ncbi:UNVERIFIED_CONTAM: hypothetical protein FKN15_010643 [Acipenser sinensis]
MVFLTLSRWIRSRGPDRYWKVQELLKHARVRQTGDTGETGKTGETGQTRQRSSEVHCEPPDSSRSDDNRSAIVTEQKPPFRLNRSL